MTRRDAVGFAVDAVLLGAGAVSLYTFVSGALARSSVDGPRLGKSLGQFGIEWRKSATNVLLILGANCRYCTMSMPFYRKLVEEANKLPSGQIVALFSHDLELGRNYLQSHDLNISTVKGSITVPWGKLFTPTLLFADSRGVIVNAWVGKINDSDEETVLSLLRSRRHIRPIIQP